MRRIIVHIKRVIPKAKVGYIRRVGKRLRPLKKAIYNIGMKRLPQWQ